MQVRMATCLRLCDLNTLSSSSQQVGPPTRQYSYPHPFPPFFPVSILQVNLSTRAAEMAAPTASIPTFPCRRTADNAQSVGTSSNATPMLPLRCPKKRESKSTAAYEHDGKSGTMVFDHSWSDQSAPTHSCAAAAETLAPAKANLLRRNVPYLPSSIPAYAVPSK